MEVVEGLLGLESNGASFLLAFSALPLARWRNVPTFFATTAAAATAAVYSFRSIIRWTCTKQLTILMPDVSPTPTNSMRYISPSARSVSSSAFLLFEVVFRAALKNRRFACCAVLCGSECLSCVGWCNMPRKKIKRKITKKRFVPKEDVKKWCWGGWACEVWGTG